MEQAPRKTEARAAIEDSAIALTNFIPHFGGFLSASLSSYINRTHTEKMVQWFDSVAESISQLESDAQQLRADFEFRDAFAHAARGAELTSNPIKLGALKNIVTNSLKEMRPTEEKRIRFIRLIDQMVPEHMHILRERRVDMGGGEFDAFASFDIRDHEMEERLRVDLETWNLMKFTQRGAESGNHYWRGVITGLGTEFIEYIS